MKKEIYNLEGIDTSLFRTEDSLYIKIRFFHLFVRSKPPLKIERPCYIPFILSITILNFILKTCNYSERIIILYTCTKEILKYRIAGLRTGKV